MKLGIIVSFLVTAVINHLVFAYLPGTRQRMTTDFAAINDEGGIVSWGSQTSPVERNLSDY